MPAINKWDTASRPRERLRDLGPTALSDAELLAIIIGGGVAGMSAIDVMNEILDDHAQSLAEIGKLSIAELSRYKGIGPAKAISIIAACEIGRRRSQMRAERQRLASSDAIFDLMHETMRDSETEEAWIVLLDNRLGFIRRACIAKGGFTSTTVDVRLALREALLSSATAIALLHNHPSGNPWPSHDDDCLTKAFNDACQTLRIRFVDHLIVSDGQYYSYRDDGKL